MLLRRHHRTEPTEPPDDTEPDDTPPDDAPPDAPQAKKAAGRSASKPKEA
ncbi:hypothetical protein ABT234_05190 [Streptomyces sp. NPDC001586]